MKNFRWCTNIDRGIEQLDLVVFLAKRACSHGMRGVWVFVV